jgi:hypothetical protein
VKDVVLRRFEIYSLARDRRDADVEALATACRRCGDYIAEVSHSAVGWNLSEAPVQLVWEHAFASPQAYQRYMIHPYHAAVLDRYILPDSPERVVTDNDLGVGLVGYSCDGPEFETSAGVRRLVLLRVARDAARGAVLRMEQALRNGPAGADEMIVSVAAANTLGPAWFDGVTPVGGRPRWTHVWEQGYVDRGGLAAYGQGRSALAAAERRRWIGWMDDIVEDAITFHYEIEGSGP